MNPSDLSFSNDKIKKSAEVLKVLLTQSDPASNRLRPRVHPGDKTRDGWHFFGDEVISQVRRVCGGISLSLGWPAPLRWAAVVAAQEHPQSNPGWVIAASCVTRLASASSTHSHTPSTNIRAHTRTHPAPQNHSCGMQTPTAPHVSLIVCWTLSLTLGVAKQQTNHFLLSSETLWFHIPVNVLEMQENAVSLMCTIVLVLTGFRIATTRASLTLATFLSYVLYDKQ